MFAYLDAGSGAALATLIASGAVGASAVLGTARQRLRARLGRGEVASAPASDGGTEDLGGHGDSPTPA